MSLFFMTELEVNADVHQLQITLVSLQSLNSFLDLQIIYNLKSDQELTKAKFNLASCHEDVTGKELHIK